MYMTHKLKIIMNKNYATLADVFNLNCTNKLLTISYAILNILGGYRMASFIVAPTWWEQVILCSVLYSIVQFTESRVFKQRKIVSVKND
jgi:hypothetical protein